MSLKITQKISLDCMYEDDPASGGYNFKDLENEISGYEKSFSGRIQVAAGATNVDLPLGAITTIKYLFIKANGTIKIKFNSSAYIPISTSLIHADLTGLKLQNDSLQPVNVTFMVAGN